MKGSNLSLLLRGSTEQLTGAMAAGRESHTLCSSSSRTRKLCSKTAYMMRPIPKEGSITEGITSTTERVQCVLGRCDQHVLHHHDNTGMLGCVSHNFQSLNAITQRPREFMCHSRHTTPMNWATCVCGQIKGTGSKTQLQLPTGMQLE